MEYIRKRRLEIERNTDRESDNSDQKEFSLISCYDVITEEKGIRKGNVVFEVGTEMMKGEHHEEF